MEKELNKFFRDLKRPSFEFVGPSYILDNTYHFVDWNRAFDELIAMPFKLARGMSAGQFVECIENAEACKKRSVKIFSAWGKSYGGS